MDHLDVFAVRYTESGYRHGNGALRMQRFFSVFNFDIVKRERAVRCFERIGEPACRKRRALRKFACNGDPAGTQRSDSIFCGCRVQDCRVLEKHHEAYHHRDPFDSSAHIGECLLSIRFGTGHGVEYVPVKVSAAVAESEVGSIR